MTPSLDLVVQSIAGETPAIRRIVLARADGGSLPAFDAGAHVTIGIPGIGPRKYSLVRTEPAASDPAPKTYTLGIRRDDNGGGGSIFMHSLKPGALLNAEPPKNDFPLKIGAAPVALVGGGIGITPLISMAAELAAKNHPYTLVYAARTRSELAFLADLERIAGPNLTLHLDDTASRIFDMLAHLKSLPPETQVYMCGPKPMLKAGMDAAKQLGWPRTRLAFELFYSAAASSRR